MPRRQKSNLMYVSQNVLSLRIVRHQESSKYTVIDSKNAESNTKLNQPGKSQNKDWSV